jgi:hypothetical protein
MIVETVSVMIHVGVPEMIVLIVIGQTDVAVKILKVHISLEFIEKSSASKQKNIKRLETYMVVIVKPSELDGFVVGLVAVTGPLVPKDEELVTFLRPVDGPDIKDDIGEEEL